MFFKIVKTKVKLINRNKRYDIVANLIGGKILTKGPDSMFKQYYKFTTLCI